MNFMWSSLVCADAMNSKGDSFNKILLHSHSLFLPWPLHNRQEIDMGYGLYAIRCINNSKKILSGDQIGNIKIKLLDGIRTKCIHPTVVRR